jgi:hypothetical protein
MSEEIQVELEARRLSTDQHRLQAEAREEKRGIIGTLPI